MTLAAVLRQIGDECSHALEVCGIDQRAPVPLGIDEAGMLEMTEMEGERRRREIEPFADLAGGNPGRSRLDQEPEDVEPRLVRQAGEGRQGICLFHISSIVEISADVNGC